MKGFAGIFVDENENAAYGVQVEMNGVIEAVPDPSGYTGYAIYVNGAVTGTSDNCPKILVDRTPGSTPQDWAFIWRVMQIR